MTMISNINRDWWFTQDREQCTDSAQFTSETKYQHIDLPHNAKNVPLNYFDETDLQQDFTYHKALVIDEAMLTEHLIIKFAGALSDNRLYVNGHLVTEHSDGYTPFEAYLTPHLKLGENIITLQLSGREQSHIPPFGGRIDFICFPGIYRDVTLERHADLRVKNVKLETLDVLNQPKLQVDIQLDDLTNTWQQACALKISVFDDEKQHVIETKVQVESGQQQLQLILDVNQPIELWHVDNPYLYEFDCSIELTDGVKAQPFRCRFGFRHCEFRNDGFFLNGERLQLIGTNRHQSYPYLGYAMGQRAQALDAELIKQWGFNMARTSHYPQSPAFLDRCDELGILVFEELPGWQHIGDEEWQQRSLDNIRAMIERDWNHPSIVIWGVRINESVDNHEFYTQANQLARELDTTRQTGGVRCFENSEFLEDVYTMNDFILGEGETIVRNPHNVTGLHQEVPYLITEYAGHMFPTKRTDCENWQMEHVTRHLKVLDASMANSNISGAITWCLFDYNTHRDFGSGDKICYHGISDAFRVPKFAADVYASQQLAEQRVVLTPVTYWTRGERPEANPLPLIILTNCDYIEMSMPTGDRKRFYPDRARYPHLKNPPVIIDQLNVGTFPLGDWGYSWMDLYLEGYVNDEKVINVDLSANPQPQELTIELQTEQLWANCSDSMRVVVQAKDQNGQLMPYLNDAITIQCSENLEVIGPQVLPLTAGSAAFWLKAQQSGVGELTIQSQRFDRQTKHISVLELTANGSGE